jgi:hypothetical protein
MIQQINERLDFNLSRVRRLISLYSPKVHGRSQVHETDILRAALVLLHASMEDYLRSLLMWIAPLGGREALDRYPLAGNDQKNGSKFSLGALAEFRGMTVDELITRSIGENLENFSSFNNIGQVKDALKSLGIPSDTTNGMETKALSEMVARRHKIVHKADRNEEQGGSGNHRVASIKLSQVNGYVDSVEGLKVFVNQHLFTP